MADTPARGLSAGATIAMALAGAVSLLPSLCTILLFDLPPRPADIAPLTSDGLILELVVIAWFGLLLHAPLFVAGILFRAIAASWRFKASLILALGSLILLLAEGLALYGIAMRPGAGLTILVYLAMMLVAIALPPWFHWTARPKQTP